MSSTDATLPLLGSETARTRGRRPSTLRVIRWELRKLAAQKRSYIGLVLAVIFPLIFVVVEVLRTHHPREGGNIFAHELTQSGLATPVLVLLWISVFLAPLIAVLVAGDIVAAEDGNGTLKTILTRSVDRTQLIVAKLVTALLYALLALVTFALVGTVAGVIAWGFNPVTTFSATVVSAPKALLLIVASYAFYMVPLGAVVAIGVMLSTVTRNSAAAVVGTLAFTLLLALVTLIPGLQGIRPYLLTQQYEAWQGLLATPTNWAPILHSLWVCALYGVPSVAGAYLVFLRRDVAGG
ncbi:MAG: ABC transporter permease [Solirubrobacteraceae bacterium]